MPLWWLLGGVTALLLLLKPSKVLARAPGAGLVAKGRVGSPFGLRQLPGETAPRQHWGIDVGHPDILGAEVRVPVAGIVVDLAPDGRRDGYGNTALVEHPDGTVTLYAHLQRFGPGIRVGLSVPAGTVIGYVGATHAPSTKFMGPHLHFEVLKTKVLTPAGRIVVNPTVPGRYEPQAWLQSKGVPVSSA